MIFNMEKTLRIPVYRAVTHIGQLPIDYFDEVSQKPDLSSTKSKREEYFGIFYGVTASISFPACGFLSNSVEPRGPFKSKLLSTTAKRRPDGALPIVSTGFIVTEITTFALSLLIMDIYSVKN